MVHTPDGGYLPLMQNDEDIAKFDTENEAREGAKSSTLGEEFGYEIFEIGSGSS